MMEFGYPVGILDTPGNDSFDERFKRDNYKFWKTQNHQHQRLGLVSSLGHMLDGKEFPMKAQPVQVESIHRSLIDCNNAESFNLHADSEKNPVSENFRQFEQGIPSHFSHYDNNSAISDVYRILWLQNEQLSLLQKQVAELVTLKSKTAENSKLVDKATTMDNDFEDICKTSSPETINACVGVDFPCVNCNYSSEYSHRKVTILREQDSGKIISRGNGRSNSPEYLSVSNPENVKDITIKEKNNLTASLAEMKIPIMETTIHSPPGSLHIDVGACNITSSSELDESDTSTDESSENIGWTFYNNVVGQVNNLLELTGQPQMPGENDKFQLPASYMSKKVTFENDQWCIKEGKHRAESDTSMRINALASKYISCGLNKGHSLSQDISMCNIVGSNSNMSMATFRYMKKHHLIKGPSTDLPRKTHKSRGKKDRILDVTAIRTQPKLLPKNSFN